MVGAVDITFPPELPVSQRRDDIAAAIRDHQVVVVAGETGSGKTTQLPKICLELGRGQGRGEPGGGIIGHTQPRRIAARSVAERIASELGTELGDVVGYQVRFTDKTSRAGRIKLMTDGILLAELQRDRDLRKYDTIIIDEAHERSLNIDFLLGYLKRLLPRRPDLKLIITSATIDPQRFAEHFADRRGRPGADHRGLRPHVPRRHPLPPSRRAPRGGRGGRDDRPRPDRGDRRRRGRAGRRGPRRHPRVPAGRAGDPRHRRGARRGARRAATRSSPSTRASPPPSSTGCSRPHTGRRIVLATNVAETSLTVPGIRYVVDSGVARISRYSARTKVQRLPIEAISQASAQQRSGRCGRVEAGIAIRLYSEEDFESRPLFTDPEILRTNLASVILQMTSLRLGEIARFPFVEPPDKRTITDGVQLLEELGAIGS